MDPQLTSWGAGYSVQRDLVNEQDCWPRKTYRAGEVALQIAPNHSWLCWSWIAISSGIWIGTQFSSYDMELNLKFHVTSWLNTKFWISTGDSTIGAGFTSRHHLNKHCFRASVQGHEDQKFTIHLWWGFKLQWNLLGFTAESSTNVSIIVTAWAKWGGHT